MIHAFSNGRLVNPQLSADFTKGQVLPTQLLGLFVYVLGQGPPA
jgi:hypothetical protein